MQENLQVLKENLEKNKIDLSKEQLTKVDLFIRIFLKYNSVMNLTRIEELSEIIDKHFFDCLYPLSEIDFKDDAKLLDIGVGGGFPSIPIKIFYEKLNVFMMDKTNKKLLFLEEAVKELNFQNCNIIHDRAEELSKNKEYRESFDFVTARALAPLNILAEYAIPYLKVGGTFFAYKSSKTSEEIKEAEILIKKLGCKIEKIFEYSLISGDSRTLIIIKKESKTPMAFPRKINRLGKN
ncbi:MAG: 16S rRNA (guanine(527)-N(7))-methyltransferase RsmG [Clostridia bacterium]